MSIFKRKEKDSGILNIINTKNRIGRYTQTLIGIFFVALSFNLFMLPNNIVCGGVSGLSIIGHDMFDIEPATFIFIASIILLLSSLVFLGKKNTARTLVGSLLFPLFVKITVPLVDLINLKDIDLLLVSIFGGVMSGFGAGLIFKSGFTTGGTDILNQIVSKYFKVSIGKAMLINDGLIVLIGGFVFGAQMVLYAIIVLYIISIMTDKVILGISQSKAFYIVTSKEKEVRAFILENLSHGMTVLDAHGGYSGDKQKVLMCVIPTKEYFKFKEGVSIIDNEAFFVVTDAYEVVGGAFKKTP
ncbi:MAG: YitT family protein [Bacilli bacterium]